MPNAECLMRLFFLLFVLRFAATNTLRFGPEILDAFAGMRREADQLLTEHGCERPDFLADRIHEFFDTVEARRALGIRTRGLRRFLVGGASLRGCRVPAIGLLGFAW